MQKEIDNEAGRIDRDFAPASGGGSIDGQIRAAEANLAAFTSKTIVIPGPPRVPCTGTRDLDGDVILQAFW